MKRRLYHFLMLAVLLAAGLSSAKAGEDVDKKVEELPKLLGSTNTGTDFWMTFLPAWPVAGGLNNIKIYVSAGVETEVYVEVKSENYLKVKKTKANDIIEFILPVTIAQPYFKTDRDATPPDQIYRQHAVHVYSKAPIICYGVTRYQYTSDGFLAIPTSGLGKQYQVASFSDVGDNGTSFGQYLPSLSSIIAPYDGTKVIFTLGGNDITRTSGGLKPGQSKTYNLNKGDVLSMASFGKSADLSGSTITANKPVGVISGNYCAYIPEDVAACDHICEMELPVNTWGTAYHVTKTFGRQKNPLIKIFAAKPNTTIYLDGRNIGKIQQPGGIEGIGYIFRRVADGTPKSYIISADGPISVTQHNPGQQDDNISSDPYQLVLTPIEQFQKEITFCTPGIGDGSGFSRNYVNLVFELDPQKNMPQELEWATVDNGAYTWTKVGEKFGFFFESFVSDVEGKWYGMKTIQLPKDGVYKIRSKYPFAAYAYGFSDYDSYGFPTSVALGDLTKKDTNRPETEYVVNCKGRYDKITVSDMPEDESVRSNLAEIYMDLENSYNYDFSFEEFVAGEDQRTRWSARPIDEAKDARAVIYFKDRKGNTRIDTLIYRAFNVTIAPDKVVDFGGFVIGESKTMDVTITNNSANNPIEITKLELADATQGFSVDASILNFWLEPLASRKIPVTFTATKISELDKNGVPVPFTTDLTVGNDCGKTSRKLTAVVAEALIVVDDHDFGKQSVGSTQEYPIRITNPGTSELVVSGASSLPAGSAFSIKAGTLPAFPFKVPAKGNITFTAVFKPTAVRTYSDNITFESNAKGTDPVCELLGEGIQPGLAVTSKAWDKLRVDLGANDTGEITITNDGTQQVTVTKVEVTGHTADFDVVDINSALGDLKAGESKKLQVQFHPTDIGPREMKIIFKNNLADGQDRVSTLSGIGVYARIETEDRNFGIVQIPGSPTQRDLTFVVKNEEFSAPIQINGLKIQEGNDGPYSYNFTAKLFRDNGTGPVAAGPFPFTLEKGETLILRDITFNPTAAGTYTRHMVVEALDDTKPHETNNSPVISKWDGAAETLPTGVGAVTTHNLDFQTLCSGDTKSMELKFGNPGDAEITVTTIEVVSPGGEFTLSGVPTTPLVLPAASTDGFTFTVIYTPNSKTGNHSGQVLFKDADGKVLATAQLSALSVDFTTKLALTTSAKKDMVPGKPFTVTVNNPTDISNDANVKSVTLTLEYDGTVVKGLAVRAENDFTVSDIKKEFNTITFTVTPKVLGPLPSGAMATVEFSTYLASNKASDIKLNVESVDAGCLVVEGNDMDITIGNICVLDFRAVSTSGKSFGMSQNYPNPSSSQTTIDLSLAFTVKTTLTLYNSMGEVVDVLMEGMLNAGSYEIDLTTTNLPSGTYFYRVEAGPFVQTNQMVIAK